jgi:hypothetical protein
MLKAITIINPAKTKSTNLFLGLGVIFKLLAILFIVFNIHICYATSKHNANKHIIQMLDKQVACWNNGDLNGYMQGYWVSDSLQFIGKSGITYGWQNTLTKYQKSYNSTAKMGKLSFTIIHINTIHKDNSIVIGKWRIDREEVPLEGYFTLHVKKINHHWLIVMDHTS